MLWFKKKESVPVTETPCAEHARILCDAFREDFTKSEFVLNCNKQIFRAIKKGLYKAQALYSTEHRCLYDETLVREYFEALGYRVEIYTGVIKFFWGLDDE